MPFDDIAFAEEDAIAVEVQINNTLDLLAPNVPDFAGQPGEDSYFIGVEQESEAGLALIAATGSENLTGEFWDPCTMANDCIAGAAVLEADQRFSLLTPT